MWIKICGNTRLEDCLLAAELGADAVGFVFAPGKRTVTAAQVAGITPHLPPSVEKIGVFVSKDAEEIVRAACEAGLTGVQLHGAYDPQLTSAVRAQLPPGGRILQVVHWWTDIPATEQSQALAAECRAVAASGIADALLIDSRTREASGGTGIAFDWAGARPALTGLPLPVVVAGGLRPDNVAAAIEALRPWGVDVSSGVEVTPGQKDAGKVREFIANARRAG
jgi:phosphoribosylanthranilate isomerase